MDTMVFIPTSVGALQMICVHAVMAPQTVVLDITMDQVIMVKVSVVFG